MSMALPDRLFVTGTGTDVGKTVVSAVLMAGLRGYYWKPVQSGATDTTDTEWIRQHTGLGKNHFLPETYSLREPLSPHTAAALEGRTIVLDEIEQPGLPAPGPLVVEGAGGIMVPLNDNNLMLDLIKQLNIPTLVVAQSGLGTINHTLLTLMQLKRCDVEVLGVVMNGPLNPGNRDAIIRFGEVKVLAEIEPLATINPESLKACFNQHFSASR